MADGLSVRCQMEWQIKNFFSLPVDDGYFMDSEHFMFCNNTWSICVIPNSNDRTNSVEIGLRRINSSFVGPLAATFGIKTSDGTAIYSMQNNLEFPYTYSARFLRAGYIDRNLLLNSKNTLVPHGNLTIVCSVSLKDKPVVEIDSPEKIDSILVQNFKKLLLSEREADITIKVKERQFKSHRSILVARSTVFATMFEHDMTESRSGLVEITDCVPDAFADFLLYIYTGKTDQVTSGNALSLYTIADKYSVEELKVKCAECMKQNLSIDSTCDVLVLATLHDESELLQSATDFFIINMKEVVQNQKWVDFHSKHLNIVTELFLKTADYINK